MEENSKSQAIQWPSNCQHQSNMDIDKVLQLSSFMGNEYPGGKAFLQILGFMVVAHVVFWETAVFLLYHFTAPTAINVWVFILKFICKGKETENLKQFEQKDKLGALGNFHYTSPEHGVLDLHLFFSDLIDLKDFKWSFDLNDFKCVNLK